MLINIYQVMKYFKEINLSCESRIKDFVIKDVKDRLNFDRIENQIRIKHELPKDLLSDLNTELNAINFPALLYCQSYIRIKNNVQRIHIDGFGDKVINAAINIPILGTTNSKHNWYAGDYRLISKNIKGLYFHDVLWKKDPILMDSLELDRPYLVRVNEPHNAIASSDDVRWIFTMRFFNNPTFEYLYDNITSSSDDSVVTSKVSIN